MIAGIWPNSHYLQPDMDQPQHLEVHPLTDEECQALDKALPRIEELLVPRGQADINSNPSALKEACDEFQRLFNTRIEVRARSACLIRQKLTELVRA